MDLEEEIRRILEKNFWLVLSTVNEKNQPQSCVVIYQSDGHNIFVQTGTETLKANNIRKNSQVSVTIPFRKNLLHKFIPAPPAELHFKATAELLPFEDAEARQVFRKYLKQINQVSLPQKSIWIKITPKSPIATYGVGIRLIQMRNPSKARNLINLKYMDRELY